MGTSLDEPARVSRDLDDLIDAYVSSALRASGISDLEPEEPPVRLDTAPGFEDDATQDEQPAYLPRIRFARGSASAPAFELDLEDEVTNVVARPVP